MTPIVGSTLGILARQALRLQSDERLAALHRSGHEEAFAELIRRYRDPLLTFSCLMLPRSSAEDVVQDSLIKADRAIRTAELPDQVRPWLFRITRNTALNAIRDRKDHVELDDQLDGVPQPPDVVESQDRFRSVVTAICALPGAQREALVLRELEGAGHDEIAAKLGTTPTAVRGLLYRARTGVRDAAGAIIPFPILTSLLGANGTAAASAGAGASGTLLVGTGGVSTVGVKLVGVGAAVMAIGAGALELRPTDPEDRARAATVGAERGGGEAGRGGGGPDQASADRVAAAAAAESDVQGRRAGEDGRSDRDEDERERDEERVEEAAEREEERREEAAEREQDRREDAAEAAQERWEEAQEAAEEAAEIKAERDEEAADRAEDEADRAEDRAEEQEDRDRD